MFLNKHKARKQDLLMCGMDKTNRLPPATERHRPPESSNKRYNKSTKIGLSQDKTRIYSHTVNIVFCFGPRLRLKTEVWAQAEQYLKNEKEDIIRGKLLPFRP